MQRIFELKFLDKAGGNSPTSLLKGYDRRVFLKTSVRNEEQVVLSN